MDRAEAGGLGIAVAAHAALFAALSMGFANAVAPPIVAEPIEVSLVEEVGVESAAPIPSPQAPAPKLAEVEGPVEDSSPAPLPIAEPTPLPEPRPAPPAPSPKKAIQRPPAKPVVAKSVTPSTKPGTRSSGRLKGLLNGIGDNPSQSKSVTPPAKTAGPAVEASLGAAVRRQLKPHWQRAVPSGADAELLRTEVSIRLALDGRVTDLKIVRTSGQTASNRPQVSLHQERARRAVMLASPFRLPAEYYDSWKELTVGLDLRLSQ